MLKLYIICFHILVTKPLQSGRTELVTAPEMPGVFCKYINLESENFIPIDISPLKILLSVSWDQKNLTNVNDASASWSEDVSTNGFKACVLVAGRHQKSDFMLKPFIHWFVFQEKLFETSKNITAGSTTLDTWYTGTQCKIIHSLSRNSADVNVYTSIEHPRKMNYQNAMTVWTEITRRSSYTKDVRVCARELQNFDGIHKGIIVVSIFLLFDHVTKLFEQEPKIKEICYFLFYFFFISFFCTFVLLKTK